MYPYPNSYIQLASSVCSLQDTGTCIVKLKKICYMVTLVYLVHKKPIELIPDEIPKVVSVAAGFESRLLVFSAVRYLSVRLSKNVHHLLLNFCVSNGLPSQ